MSKDKLPPLFYYMEMGDWTAATERVRKHPRDVKTWATLRTKSMQGQGKTSGCKRLALHHACFKLRNAASLPPQPLQDPFIENCRFVLTLVRMYPEAASQRESRHGCLPLHLAAFSACVSQTTNDKPASIARRSASDATAETHRSNVFREESTKREEMAVQVINALLDAYPKAIRVDSEGGRLPLHVACAGRATPRVIATLVTAYPQAARHRNKDGFLPLHLAAHWGVSHPNVPILLLKAYPDATVGRNRWERTPLEEALCMAGENGRTYQRALVQALRKHPSFWNRPSRELLAPTIVDTDVTLPSDESTTVVEDIVTVTSSTTTNAPKDLVGCIAAQNWPAVIARLEKHPLEAEQELKVLTMGGFAASTGFYALHYACERKPPPYVVHALIEAFPIAVVSRCMPGGTLPIHVACTWHAGPEVVSALLSADPTTTKVTDELGNIPLHSACFAGAAVPVVEALISVHSDAVIVRNHQGSRPIDITKRLKHDNRRRVMQVLTVVKDRVLKHHRSRSSGNWSEVAKEALQEECDLAAGSGFEVNDDDVVEVAYDQDEENQELVWI